jgi:hypothetical protein
MADTGRSSGGDLGSPEKQTTSSIQQPPALTNAVEMENLTPKPPVNTETTTTSTAAASTSNVDNTTAAELPDKTASTTSQPTSTDPDGDASASSKALGKAPAAVEQDPLSIGPADSSMGAAPAAGDGELAVDIMLIATQSNTRHPFRINEKYLTKRNVNVTGMTEDGKMDPFSITVYTLKELILRDWRSDWEAPPREPTSIRLIYFGKLLEDKLPLNRMFCFRVSFSWSLSY